MALTVSVSLPENVILMSFVQLKNTNSRMLVTPLPIVILVRLVQPENAPVSMPVTPLPIVILVRLVQS